MFEINNLNLAQNFLNYFCLAIFYGTYINFQNNNQQSFVNILRQRGWKYLLLSIIDVEANCLIVYAYQFTNLTSIQVFKLKKSFRMLKI